MISVINSQVLNRVTSGVASGGAQGSATSALHPLLANPLKKSFSENKSEFEEPLQKITEKGVTIQQPQELIEEQNEQLQGARRPSALLQQKVQTCETSILGLMEAGQNMSKRVEEDQLVLPDLDILQTELTSSQELVNDLTNKLTAALR